MKEEKKRTLAQNNAMHLWFDLLATELNNAGLTIMKTLKANAEIEWSDVTVKEILFKQLMKSMLHKESTTQLTTKEVSQVSETLIRYLAEKHGLLVEFPSMESLIADKRIDDL